MLSTVAPPRGGKILMPEKTSTPITVSKSSAPKQLDGRRTSLGAGSGIHRADGRELSPRGAMAADRLEAMYRASPGNVVGRGLCAPYEAGQPPTMFDPDSHCWINLTQRQIAQGTVRPHDFPYDDTPYGRERHWSSSFSWWLLAVGEATHLWTGLPLARRHDAIGGLGEPCPFRAVPRCARADAAACVWRVDRPAFSS